MLVNLEGKKILVGVTGSIAAYKTLELIRLFIKSKAEVKVIMTSSAKRFVGKISFEALSLNEVIDESSESWSNGNNHIELGRWCDLYIVAPATANTINRLSNGICDNILTQTAIACDKIKLIAPAANVRMLENPITEASVKMLKICGYDFIDTQSKMLACSENANGAMADPLQIYYRCAKELMKDDFWLQRRVVVSAGGSIEKIDDVRFLSNFSSGKMGLSMALALYLKGADVCLITSSNIFELPLEIYKLEVSSADEFKSYIEDAIRVAKKGTLSKVSLMDNETKVKLIQKKPYLFMSAAISDYKAQFPQNGKIKKDNLGEKWSLKLVKNQDILANIDKDDIVTIGFKAEMDLQNATKNAKNMLSNKNLDGVCLNILKSSEDFGSDTNKITFLSKDWHKEFEGRKVDIAFDILEASKDLC